MSGAPADTGGQRHPGRVTSRRPTHAHPTSGRPFMRRRRFGRRGGLGNLLGLLFLLRHPVVLLVLAVVVLVVYLYRRRR